jgi:mono/diheme cytochrome c family protein
MAIGQCSMDCERSRIHGKPAWPRETNEGMTMAKSSKSVVAPPLDRMTLQRCGLRFAGAFSVALWLAGCVVEVQNTQPAQEMARRAQPPGSLYTGWRVFQERCVGCHGPDAIGTASGPDLLPRVRDMGPRRFVDLVLNRYDWSLPAAPSGSGSAAREALVEDIVQRRQGLLAMPPWQGEPRVTAHIVDVYAYLSARAPGTQGPGRPAP